MKKLPLIRNATRVRWPNTRDKKNAGIIRYIDFTRNLHGMMSVRFDQTARSLIYVVVRDLGTINHFYKYVVGHIHLSILYVLYYCRFHEFIFSITILMSRSSPQTVIANAFRSYLT